MGNNHTFFDQASATLLGFCICNVIAEMAESFTISSSFCLPSSQFPPSFRTGHTLCSRNNVATTATNSTCANFCPGQIRGPSAQGMNWPCGGSMSPPLGVIQRLGFQVKESGPQKRGLQWMAWVFMLIAVLGGRRCWVEPMTRVCSRGPVVLGMKTMEP